MAFQFQILSNEITADPEGIGYAGMTNIQVADALNLENQADDREFVPTGEILGAIVPADFVAIADAAHRTYLQILLATDAVPLGSANIRLALANIFSGAPTTLAALAALQQSNISRARVLGLGRVAEGHVAHARTL